jgi:hypothetical protein
MSDSTPLSATADAPARRILVLFAHPSLDRSEANRPLAEAARAVEGVTLADLYAEYPSFEIDVDREQERLLAHDVICFLHPLYWYSTPAILKEWQDLVLEHGFAYGAEGNALRGKLFFNALTAGGAESAYCARARTISPFASCCARWSRPRSCAACAICRRLRCLVRAPRWKRGASPRIWPIGPGCSVHCAIAGWTCRAPWRCRTSTKTSTPSSDRRLRAKGASSGPARRTLSGQRRADAWMACCSIPLSISAPR